MAALKFLVVDDATFIREMLKKNLRDHFPGSEILDAASAKKAIPILKANRVDLILCDWEMPDMTGEEFLRWVRAQEAYAELPFIMVTSRGERDFIVKAAQAGVSDYLGKPFTPEGLVGKVTKALAKVGKTVKPAGVPNANDNSLGVLTGGAGAAVSKPKAAAVMNDSASVLTASAPARQNLQQKNPKISRKPEVRRCSRLPDSIPSV
ncbi:response regulator [Oceanicoccus sp. KOV_DT_Chl]|uniref:response regulator n=1 Tax=Oceanicoccus sp. KOV_DT_Chl TaxID=1904639 RepID=UPI00190E90F1|nr:response regulator [Oceanicoccus sp. KOV_DT_Chl]